METAALIISGLGILVAAMSWYESRKARRSAELSADSAQQSAEAASETARIEAERRHDELAPRLRSEWVELEQQGDAWGWGIRLHNERSIEYVEVEAELLPPVAGEQPAAEAIQSVSTRHAGRQIPMGQLSAQGSTAAIVHPVFEDDGLERGGPFRVRLVLTTEDGGSWRHVVTESVPHPPRIA